MLFTFITGSVSNGEFNTLRARGYSRPVSILQVRADVRAKYAKIKQSVLKSMLTPLRKCVFLEAQQIHISYPQSFQMVPWSQNTQIVLCLHHCSKRFWSGIEVGLHMQIFSVD